MFFDQDVKGENAFSMELEHLAILLEMGRRLDVCPTDSSDFMPNYLKKLYHELSRMHCSTYIADRGRFKHAYELLNVRALKILTLYKNRIFQCIGKIFCVEC